MRESRELEPGPLHGMPLCALIGPTAVGKSALALRVAKLAGAEIVSLDSMQVYRGMDIGTSKATRAERELVRHHMLDQVEPNERYDVQRFLRDLGPVLADMRARSARALFVGGTGFYLKVLASGLFQGPDVDAQLRAELEQRAHAGGLAAMHAELTRVDPAAAARIHPNDQKRVVRALEVHTQTGKPLSEWQVQWTSSLPARLVGLALPVPELDQRIERRTRAMLAAGWPAEAAHVRATSGFGPTAVQALGYAEALALHDGQIELDACVAAITRKTRQFARRQRTWYRKFEVTWLPASAEKVAEDVSGAQAELVLRAFDW